MDATARYLLAANGAVVKVFGVRLLPLSFGHAELLARHTAWRPMESVPLAIMDFVTGLFICSRPWRRAARAIWTRAPIRFAGWQGIKVRFMPSRAEIAVKAYEQYLELHTDVPEARPIRTVPSRKPFGTPLLARLRLFGFSDLHLSPDALRDMAYAELACLWIYRMEMEGNINVVSDDDIDFRQWAEEQDRIRAHAANPS